MLVVPTQSCTFQYRGLGASSDVCGLEPKEPQSQGGSSIESERSNMQCRSARNLESFQSRFRDPRELESGFVSTNYSVKCHYQRLHFNYRTRPGSRSERSFQMRTLKEYDS